MKIDRFIGILIILMQEGRVTAPELAERFGVSRRTINRDVEDICRLGIPLVTFQGYGGGISIEEGYKIDESILEQEEMRELMEEQEMADKISRETYFCRILEEFADKDDCVMVDDAIMIDMTSNSPPSTAKKMEMIKKKIREQHLISFYYYHRRGECQKVIEPYRLIMRGTGWYVLGYSRREEAFQLFHLNRVTRLRDMGEVFLMRDVSEDEIRSADSFTAADICLKAVFDASEKYRLVESYGEDAYSVTADGRLLFRHNFSDYHRMLEWVLSFGGKVEVLKPEILREDLRTQAKLMLERLMAEG